MEAFSNCDKLAEVVIPDSVTSIGNSSFYHCSSLTKITIPNSVIIVEDAFSNCYNLSDITLSNALRILEYQTFLAYERLKSITIPDSVVSIDSGAFSLCDSLTTIYGTEGSYVQAFVEMANEGNVLHVEFITK